MTRVTATARAAAPGDERAIAEIRVLGWRTAYRGLVADSVLDAMSVEADTSAWTTLLAGQDRLRRTLVVATVDGRRVLGFCSLGPYRAMDLDDGLDVVALALPGTVGEVYACYVHPDAWGSGVADDLMGAALEALSADGWTSARLWLLAENSRARRFYERHGWTADGQGQTLPLPGEPREIRLARPLPPERDDGLSR